jgi:hypothetical protein
MIAAVALPKEWIFMPVLVPDRHRIKNDAPNLTKYQRM